MASPSDETSRVGESAASGEGNGELREHGYQGVPPLTGLAVMSLVLGILSLMSALLLLPAIGAVFAGHLAIHKIRHANRLLGGHRLAVTGLVMGYVSIVMFSVLVLAGFLLWPRFAPQIKERFAEFQEYQPRKAMRKASELYRLCERYARENSGAYPAQWEDLEKGYSNALDMKDWLSSVHTNDPDYRPAFQLLRHERPVFESVKHRVAVIQERAPPEVAQVVVVFADGHTELIPNPERE
jgi:hypothetical protein